MKNRFETNGPWKSIRTMKKTKNLGKYSKTGARKNRQKEHVFAQASFAGQTKEKKPRRGVQAKSLSQVIGV